MSGTSMLDSLALGGAEAISLGGSRLGSGGLGSGSFGFGVSLGAGGASEGPVSSLPLPGGPFPLPFSGRPREVPGPSDEALFWVFSPLPGRPMGRAGGTTPADRVPVSADEERGATDAPLGTELLGSTAKRRREGAGGAGFVARLGTELGLAATGFVAGGCDLRGL